MLGPKTSVEKWHFLVWNQITQPINPNPYPNQTPSKDSTKKYPPPPPPPPPTPPPPKQTPTKDYTKKYPSPPPPRGVWIHTFLWQLNLCLFCIELKNLLDINKKGTECHVYSVVGDRELKKKKQSAYGFVLTQNSIGNAIFMTNIRCVMLIHLLNDNLRASDTICVNFCISCTDQRPFLHKCFKISVLYFSFSKPLSNALEYL